MTLSSRPSSTSCFPSAFYTSFTSLGEYIAPAIVSFCPIKSTRRLSLASSPASNVASLELLVAHLVFPRANPCTSRSSVTVMRQRHIGPCTKCILPSLRNPRISDMHQLDACSRCSRNKCVPMSNCLSHALMHACVNRLSVLHFLNLSLRSFLAGVQKCAKGHAWRASNQEFCLKFLLHLFLFLFVLSRSEIPELSVVTFCCHVNEDT